MSELVQRFIDRFHDTDYYTNLVNAWQSARRAQARQVDEWTILTLFLELGEVVVRELATLAFSLSVSGAGLESDFRGFRTSGERTFGTEVEILRLLKDRHPVRQLMGARPTPQDALRPLGQLVGHMGQLIHPQHDAAWFNDAIRKTSPNDDHTTWRQAVDHLCAIRNIQFHATARLDKGRPQPGTPCRHLFGEVTSTSMPSSAIWIGTAPKLLMASTRTDSPACRAASHSAGSGFSRPVEVSQ